jgi:hypothetical protein
MACCWWDGVWVREEGREGVLKSPPPLFERRDEGRAGAEVGVRRVDREGGR